jgi:hypothetical protein
MLLTSTTFLWNIGASLPSTQIGLYSRELLETRHVRTSSRQTSYRIQPGLKLRVGVLKRRIDLTFSPFGGRPTKPSTPNMVANLCHDCAKIFKGHRRPLAGSGLLSRRSAVHLREAAANGCYICKTIHDDERWKASHSALQPSPESYFHFNLTVTPLGGRLTGWFDLQIYAESAPASSTMLKGKWHFYLQPKRGMSTSFANSIAVLS